MGTVKSMGPATVSILEALTAVMMASLSSTSVVPFEDVPHPVEDRKWQRTVPLLAGATGERVGEGLGVFTRKGDLKPVCGCQPNSPHWFTAKSPNAWAPSGKASATAGVPNFGLKPCCRLCFQNVA